MVFSPRIAFKLAKGEANSMVEYDQPTPSFFDESLKEIIEKIKKEFDFE